jgi:hypothetical protein
MSSPLSPLFRLATPLDNFTDIDEYRKNKGTARNFSIMLISDGDLNFEKLGAYTDASDFVNQINSVIAHLSSMYTFTGTVTTTDKNNYVFKLTKYGTMNNKPVSFIVRAYTSNANEARTLRNSKYL